MFRPLPKEEINRKLLHLVALVIPWTIFYLPRLTGRTQTFPVYLLFGMLFLYFLVEYSRRRSERTRAVFVSLFGLLLRADERDRPTGGVYIVASSALCAVVFYTSPHVAFMCLSMFILGDAVAALVGMSMGRVRIHGKTLEGSAACFFLSIILCTLVFPSLPMLLDAWGGRLSIPVTLAAALSTTLFELFPPGIPGRLKINDNLSVPLLTGVFMVLAHHLTV